MRLALTLMVRDEADIVGAMLQHHAEQGVDVFVITDNGSADGTVEIIEEFARDHDVDLRHDPEHKKQQSRVVSGMARDAATRHHADWVINADADEFWMPIDRALRIHDAVEQYDPEIGAFPVSVVDMTGPPARSGTGLDRLVYRDVRPLEMLFRVGLHDHSTFDTMHVADPDVTVLHGNHFVSTPSRGRPPAELALEVLHLPWRSWEQFERKVRNAGLAFAANPELKPSPNHHGLRDYRRLLAGTLEETYIIRHPDDEQIADGIARGWFTEDRVLADSTLPRRADELYDNAESARLRASGADVVAADAEEIRRRFIESKQRRVDELEEANSLLRLHTAALESEISRLRSRRIVRLVDHAALWLRGGDRPADGGRTP